MKNRWSGGKLSGSSPAEQRVIKTGENTINAYGTGYSGQKGRVGSSPRSHTLSHRCPSFSSHGFLHRSPGNRMSEVRMTRRCDCLSSLRWTTGTSYSPTKTSAMRSETCHWTTASVSTLVRTVLMPSPNGLVGRPVWALQKRLFPSIPVPFLVSPFGQWYVYRVKCLSVSAQVSYSSHWPLNADHWSGISVERLLLFVSQCVKGSNFVSHLVLFITDRKRLTAIAQRCLISNLIKYQIDGMRKNCKQWLTSKSD